MNMSGYIEKGNKDCKLHKSWWLTDLNMENHYYPCGPNIIKRVHETCKREIEEPVLK